MLGSNGKQTSDVLLCFFFPPLFDLFTVNVQQITKEFENVLPSGRPNRNPQPSCGFQEMESAHSVFKVPVK